MITESMARGDSPAVTAEEYREHSTAGSVALSAILASRINPVTREMAFNAVREPWGGMTLSTANQLPEFRERGFAVAVAGPGNARGTLAVTYPSPDDPTWRDDTFRDVFYRTYAEASQRFAWAPYLGIFRDDDLGMIEFDPVVITESEQEARDIATFCESLGGAYDYSTGNGIFPYHVLSTSNVTANR